MVLAVRALVIIAIPGLVFGWLATARILPGPPDWDTVLPPDPATATATFLVGGVVFVVAGSIVLTLGDVARAFRLASTAPLVPPRPIAMPVVVVSALVGLGTLSMSGLYLDAAETLRVWLEVALAAAVGAAVLLSVVVLAHSLVGLWWVPDLAMWPGRRTATFVVLLAVLAATPVKDGRLQTGGFAVESRTLVPMVERVRMELSGDRGRPAWRYHVDDVILL